jgi:hypothetical protein
VIVDFNVSRMLFLYSSISLHFFFGIIFQIWIELIIASYPFVASLETNGFPLSLPSKLIAPSLSRERFS